MEYVTFEYLQSIKWIIKAFVFFVAIPSFFFWVGIITHLFKDDTKEEDVSKNVDYRELYFDAMQKVIEKDEKIKALQNLLRSMKKD